MAWKIIVEDVFFARQGFFQQHRFSLFDPFIRAQAVGEIRVDVLGLHYLQGLAGAEIMSLVAETDILEHLETECLLVDLDTSGDAQCRAEHVVVHQQGLRAGAEQARVHAGRFVDDIGARGGGAGQRIGAFRTGLEIGKLGIAHTAGSAGRQVEVDTHLRAGGGQDCLFR